MSTTGHSVKASLKQYPTLVGMAYVSLLSKERTNGGVCMDSVMSGNTGP